MADAARELGIDLDQPPSVNDPPARARITQTEPEAVCVCAFGALIKEPLLSEHWMVNVHPSLLPRWRGAAPVERAIMAGDGVTGVSIMRVTAGLDAGPVCAQARETVSDEDTYGSLAPRLATRGAELLTTVLEERPPCHDQDDARATYAEKITAEDRVLDPARPAAELDRVVRALAPHIGAHVRLSDGELLGVRAARSRHDGPAQGDLQDFGGQLVLGCADGALELLVVQPAGKRAMSAEDYLRGHRP